jgi:hypothetical protein
MKILFLFSFWLWYSGLTPDSESIQYYYSVFSIILKYSVHLRIPRLITQCISYYFYRNFAVVFFSGGEFSAVLTPDSGRALGPLPMFLIPSGVLWEIICKFFFVFDLLALRLLWAEIPIPPKIYNVLWHTRYTLCAHWSVGYTYTVLLCHCLIVEYKRGGGGHRLGFVLFTYGFSIFKKFGSHSRFRCPQPKYVKYLWNLFDRCTFFSILSCFKVVVIVKKMFFKFKFFVPEALFSDFKWHFNT